MKWLEYEEVILKYFKYQLRRPRVDCEEMELLGSKDENGNFKSNEEIHKERMEEQEKINQAEKSS